MRSRTGAGRDSVAGSGRGTGSSGRLSGGTGWVAGRRVAGATTGGVAGAAAQRAAGATRGGAAGAAARRVGGATSGVLAGLALGGLAVRGWHGANAEIADAAAGPAGAGGLDRLLGAAAWLGLLGCLAYAAVVLALAGFAALPSALGRAAAIVVAAITPAALRRVLCLALGTGLVLAPTAAVAPTTAQADSGGPQGTPSAEATAAAVPSTRALPLVPLDRPAATVATSPSSAPSGSTASPGPALVHLPTSATGSQRPAELPPRPTSATAPTSAPTTPTRGGDSLPALPRADGVVVRPGDSLWRIASRALGPHATTAEVARAWPLWWAANRAVVGPDPDLIRPGQRLVAPTDPHPARPSEEPR